MSTTPTETPKSPHHRRRPHGKALLAVLAVAALTAIAVPLAFAGWGLSHGGCRFHRGDVTDDQVREHVDRTAAHVLDEVEATDEQREQIAALHDELLPPLLDLRREGKALRDAFHQALAADSPDRAELDRLRREGLGLLDEASGTLLDALLKASQVLTPEQRETIAERIRERHGR